MCSRRAAWPTTTGRTSPAAPAVSCWKCMTSHLRRGDDPQAGGSRSPAGCLSPGFSAGSMQDGAGADDRSTAGDVTDGPADQWCLARARTGTADPATAISNARRPRSATGSRRTDGPAPPARTASRAQPGRYHLYVSLACPWAHRTLIMRALKGLRGDHPGLGDALADGRARLDLRARRGRDRRPAVQQPHICTRSIRRADGHYSGRVSVPVLWDQHTQTIVNNESSDIIRMLNGAFDAVGAKPGDYYPQALRAEIDASQPRASTTR